MMASIFSISEEIIINIRIIDARINEKFNLI